MAALLECVAGTGLVVGHNVWHNLPNEVPLLFVMFWASNRLRTGEWRSASFRRPTSPWWQTLLVAALAAAALQLGSEFLIQPLARHFWARPEQVSTLLRQSSAAGSLALRNLVLVWTFAAFGEEIGYRGYLLQRAADLGGRSKLAYGVALIYVSVLFGFGHFYKGAPGILDSAYSGVVLGAVYVFSGCNLWAPILAHGLSDTVAVVALYMGWAN